MKVTQERQRSGLRATNVVEIRSQTKYRVCFHNPLHSENYSGETEMHETWATEVDDTLSGYRNEVTLFAEVIDRWITPVSHGDCSSILTVR
jgi:hypothetical protein